MAWLILGIPQTAGESEVQLFSALLVWFPFLTPKRSFALNEEEQRCQEIRVLGSGMGSLLRQPLVY